MIIYRNLICAIHTSICLLVSIPCWADPSLLDPLKTTITRTEHNLIVETINNGVVNKQSFLLVHVPKGMPMFHWTSETNYARWISQGRLDEGEVRFLSTPSDTDLNHYGPGVYASSSPIDSKSFGVKTAVFEMPADFSLVQGAIQDPDMHELLRRNGIKGTKITDSWYTFFDHEPLQKVREHTAEDLIKYLTVNPIQKLTKEKVKTLAQTFEIPLGDWLEKIDQPLYRLLNGKEVSPIEIQKLAAYYFEGIFLATHSKFSQQFSKAISPKNRGEFMTHEMVSLTKRNKDYEHLIELDQKYGPLTATKELKTEFPKLHKLLSGQMLSKAEKEELTSFIKESYSLLRSRTPLTEALMSQIGPDVRSHLLASFLKEQDESKKNVIIQASRSWGLDLSRLDEGLVDTGSTLFPKGIIPPKSRLSSTAQDLLRSFEFIDFYDLLNGFATDNGNIIHAYDTPGKTPLIDRWKAAAMSSKDTDIESIHNLIEQTDSSKVRNQRIIAGGEIHVPGSDVGYYRLNERGLQTLKDNPYLTLTILDDPYQPNPGVKTYLVRHEYPSAYTFKRFENLLSEDLRNELIELYRS